MDELDPKRRYDPGAAREVVLNIADSGIQRGRPHRNTKTIKSNSIAASNINIERLVSRYTV